MPLLALVRPTTYAFAPPSFREMAKPRWLADMSVGIGASLAAKPQAEIPVDPIAAAKVDEDLDYRIAERTRSAEGWRAPRIRTDPTRNPFARNSTNWLRP